MDDCAYVKIEENEDDQEHYYYYYHADLNLLLKKET